MPSSLYGPIVLIEDDPDDQEIIKEVLRDLDLPNEVRVFHTCREAFDYLIQTEENPMIIISDVNLPVMNGLEFKRKVDAVDRLRKKAIPFVYMSTSDNPEFIEEAYFLQAQGYFKKPNSIAELREIMDILLKYWKVCKHPK